MLQVYISEQRSFTTFEGVRVLGVKRIDTPVCRSDALNQDYLMILSLNSTYVVKALHVKPKIKLMRN